MLQREYINIIEVIEIPSVQVVLPIAAEIEKESFCR